MQLTSFQKEKLISYQLSKCGEHFIKRINEIAAKWKLLESENAPFTKVLIKISDFRDGGLEIVYEKSFLLISVKEQFLVDLIANSSALSKQIESYSLWGISFDIHFYKPDGSRNGGIVDFHINPDAWTQEFLKNK